MPPGTYRDPATGKVKARPGQNNTARKKVRVKKAEPTLAPGLTQDPVTGIVVPAGPAEYQKPKKPPRRQDWREDPGGGYVDINSPGYKQGRGTRIDYAPTRAGRAQQERAFKAYRRGMDEQQRQMIAAAQRAQILHKQLALFMAGQPSEHHGWLHKAIGAIGHTLDFTGKLGEHVMDSVANYSIEKSDAQVWHDLTVQAAAFNAAVASLPTTAATNLGLPKGADEAVRRQVIGSSGLTKQDQQKAMHYSHAIQEAIGGSLAKPGFQASDPLDAVLLLVGTALSPLRAGRIGLAAGKGLRAGEGISASARLGANAASGPGLTRQGLARLHEWARGTRDLTEGSKLMQSPARAAVAAGVHATLGEKDGDAFMRIADGLVIQAKERLEANMPEYKDFLDRKIADGTATTADRELRRDLALWSVHGVPDDAAYTYIHEFRGEIPQWLREEWQRQYPDYDIRFRLSDLEHPFAPTREEAATNLKRRVGIPELVLKNTAVLDEHGIPMIGPISFADRAKRLMLATPDIAVRRHDSSFYSTLESGFSSILGDREIMAWLASQVGASPSRGVLDLTRVINRIREGGTVGENEIGLAAKAMEQILRGEHGLSKGAAAKISDFIDSAIGSSTRRWVGNDPAGGVPFVADRWSGRAEGMVDEPFLRKLAAKGIENPHLDIPGDGLTAVQYEQVAKSGEDFTQYLNQIGFDGRHDWVPSEVQAMEWAGIQRYWGEHPEDIRKAITVNAHTFSFEATRGMSNLGADLTRSQTRTLSQRLLPAAENLIRSHFPDAILSKGRISVDGWAEGENVAMHFDALGLSDKQAQEMATMLAQAFDQGLVQVTKNATKGAKRSLMFASPAFKNEQTKVRFMKAFYRNAPDYAPHGYMTDILHGDPATVIITGKPYMAAAKSNQTWVKDLEEAITKAEAEVGIDVRYTASNHQIMIGDKHGPASFTAEGGRERALEDLHPAARSVREQLDAELARFRGGTELHPSADREGIDREIAKVERQIDSLIRDRARALGGHDGAFMPSGGRARGTNREWEPGIGRRGAIGGRPGRYLEPETKAYGLRRTGWQNAIRAAEDQLIEENGHAAQLMDRLSELRDQREATYPDWLQGRQSGRLHGVEAHSTEPSHAQHVPVGKSGIYVGSTPMKVTTSAHEFWGHYMYRWLTPTQKKTLARMIGDDPEAFPQMIEEYLLAAAEGRKPEVPHQLVGSLETLSRKALQEFEDYAATPGARSRVHMPDDVAAFIDGLMSFHGDRLTSRFGIRTLSAGDLEAQIPGTARSRITQALIERPSDAVSKWLGAKDIARKVPAVRLATEQERVAKAAGRENVLDAHRAHAQMIHFERAMPRQGTPEDVAHFWWAQMPEDKRTVEGLGDVRAKLQENLDEIQSGDALAKLQERLDNARGIEDAFERLQRQQSLKLLIADLPHQAEDLQTAIGALDHTIQKAPVYDPKIVEAVQAVSTARRNTLQAAGLLDFDTAKAREGLVSRWLGYEPTGEEVFIGHRGGETRGANEALMPRSVGTGRVRTPEGVKTENKLILANQGRLNMSTHVAYHDWEASEVYANTLRFRNDASLMGKPYEGGRLPKDTYLFNPKGKIVPRAWKRDPFANLQDDKAIEDAANEVNRTFMAASQEEVDAMIEEAKATGISLDSLRVVDKRLVDRYYQQFARAPAKTVGGKVYDTGMNFVMTSIIFARAGYIPKNIVQNLIMAVPHQGAFFLTNAPRAAQLLADAEMRDLLRVEVGSGVTGALIKEASTVKGLKNIPSKVAGGVTHIADDPIRMSAWIHEAAKEGVVPRIGTRLSEADKARIRDVLTNPQNKALANDIAQRTRNSMADFNRMTNKQRMWARRFLVIPGWLVAGTRYPFVFAAHYPMRTLAMGYALAGEPGADYLGLPQNPNIASQFLSGGKRFGDFITGVPIPGTGGRVLRTNSISPVNTPWDIARAAAGQSPETAFSYANPLASALINVSQKRPNDWSDPTNLKAALEGNALSLLPGVTFAQDMLEGGGGGGFGARYPEDNTVWGRFKRELGIVPIKIGEKISKSDAGLYAEARKLAPNSDFAPLEDAMSFKTQVAAARRAAGAGPDYNAKAYVGELQVLRDRHLISPAQYTSMTSAAKGADVTDIKEWRDWIHTQFFEPGYLEPIRSWRKFVAGAATSQ